MYFKLLLTLFAIALIEPALARTFAPLAPNLGLSAAQVTALPQTADGKYAIYGDMLLQIGEGTLAEVPNIWPNGVLIYRFDTSVDETQKTAFRTACAAWTVNTPIVCRERTSQTAYMMVYNDDAGGGGAAGCSPVGYSGAVEDMHIGPNYWDQRVLQHEIGHALGKVHEQSRSDRDSYVDIHFERVIAGQAHNFDIEPAARLLTEYDYDSIMHYTTCAFSIYSDCTPTKIDKKTMVVRSCARDTAGGSTITALDLDGIRNAYAPKLAALLVRERGSQCGIGFFHPDMLTADAAIFPLANSPVGWKKVEENYSKTCGMAPGGFGQQCRAPKELKAWWDDTDSHPLNLSCPSVYEVWAECGCKVVSEPMACTNIGKFAETYAALGVEKASFQDPEQWRTTRLLYFQAITEELKSSELLSADVLVYLPGFYLMNYLDPKFETRMFRVRAGMYAYAHWKSSVVPW